MHWYHYLIIGWGVALIWICYLVVKAPIIEDENMEDDRWLRNTIPSNKRA